VSSTTPNPLAEIDAQIRAATVDMLRACESYVEQYRANVLPLLADALRGLAFRVLPCPRCGRQFAVSLLETRSLMCCGRELSVAIVAPRPGSVVSWPDADQFVEPPAVAGEAPSEIPW
jgi:hypothetical protein